MPLKANATVYFLDGRSLDVVETLVQVTTLVADGCNVRYGITVTKTNGDKAWANPVHICRIEPA